MPKINQLNQTTSLSNTDVLAAENANGANTRKIAYASLRTQIQNESRSVFALHGEIASDEQVATAASDWLNSHVTPTGSTVALDDTLLIQGAAADAKAAGEIIVVNGTSGNGTRVNITTTDTDIELAEMSDVNDLKNALIKYNSVDVFDGITSTASATVSGVTYTYQDGLWLIYTNGTTSSTSYKSLVAKSNIPEDLIPGKPYNIKFNSTSVYVTILISFFDSLDSATYIPLIYTDTVFTVPSSAKKWAVYLRVASGTNISQSSPVICSGIALFNHSSNEELQREIDCAEEKINKIAYEIKTNQFASHGVSELPLKWKEKTASNYTTGVYAATSNQTATTELVPLPESGIYIYTENLTPFKVHFWKKQSEEYVPATDYPYCWTNLDASLSETYWTYARYYPYASGVYFTITAFNGAGVDTDALPLHCYCGEITDNGGRLPNLSPIAIFLKHGGGVIENQSLVFYNGDGYYRLGSSDPYVNALESKSKYYFSILRLQDVDRIVIAPPYSAVARIYKTDNDNKHFVGQSEVFCPVDSSALSPIIGNVMGVSEIDLRNYNYNGYVVLGIVPRIEEIAKTTYMTYKITSNGMLNAYDDVYSHVYVEWKPGVSVSYDSGIPAIAKQNINTVLKNTFATNLMSSPSNGGYGSYIDANSVIPFPSMGRVTGWWYNGSNNYNVPHMHVNPKSYITASKNRYSRVYIPEFPNSPIGSKNNLYGSVCSSTCGLVCGKPIGIETIAIASGVFPDMECRDYTCLDDIKAGDIIAGSYLYDDNGTGHVVYGYERVTINGELYCINVFEGKVPWTSFRAYINLDAYDGYTVSTYKSDANMNGIFNYFSNRYWDNYDKVVLARLSRTSYKSIRDAYGTYDVQDYPVTSIMCDRGTDSVYAIGEHMTLTVTDGTTSIDLHKNGSSIGTIDLTGYSVETFADAKVYTVTGMVSTAGYYEIYAGGSKKESFYVPPDRTAEATLIDMETCRVKFSPNEENDEVIAISVDYYSATKPKVMPVAYFDNIDATTIDGEGLCTFDAPRYVEFYDELRRGAISVEVVRKTPFGTYETKWWIYQDGNNPGYRQRAGLMLTQESENG